MGVGLCPWLAHLGSRVLDDVALEGALEDLQDLALLRRQVAVLQRGGGRDTKQVAVRQWGGRRIEGTRVCVGNLDWKTMRLGAQTVSVWPEP